MENCLNEPRQGHLDLIQLMDDGQQIVNGWDVKAPAKQLSAGRWPLPRRSRATDAFEPG